MGLGLIGSFATSTKSSTVTPSSANQIAPLLDKDSSLTLQQDRSSFSTNLSNPFDFPDESAPTPPAELFNLITYPSPAGDLEAYLTPDPGDGKRHAAVLWAHGGFGGIGSWLWESAPPENDQSVAAFCDAGLIVMCPSWRGENANPGSFELFYGEVDDLHAALKHLKTIPYIDPDRIYLAGHSTGGTLTLLAAVSTADFRAAFSFGGAPDIYEVVRDGVGYENTPFDFNNRNESDLRSAIRYTRFISRPTFYFEGSDSSYPNEAKRMMRLANKHNSPFIAYILTGFDHFNILAPLTELLAEKIVQDTDSLCNIQFDEDELYQALKKLPPGVEAEAVVE
jgi:pimeloyl-ACP methyl ester carboxylesterase